MTNNPDQAPSTTSHAPTTLESVFFAARAVIFEYPREVAVRTFDDESQLVTAGTKLGNFVLRVSREQPADKDYIEEQVELSTSDQSKMYRLSAESGASVDGLHARMKAMQGSADPSVSETANETLRTKFSPNLGSRVVKFSDNAADNTMSSHEALRLLQSGVRPQHPGWEDAVTLADIMQQNGRKPEEILGIAASRN